MTDPLTWQAVVSKFIDALPGILAALAACLAYMNRVNQASVKAMVAARADTQDVKLDQIHEATNGGVQKLRDEVNSLKGLLATAVEELRTEQAKP